ncbi:MAG: Uma2 family endonuclease [Betaproteobacteria bacterium]|nr:Uma2 family endonuclease [Betaproteobacteria bacterium]
MSAVVNRPRFADAEAFLAWEALQPERHEYVDGQVYPKTGALGAQDTIAHNTVAHNTITLNAYASLRPALKGTPCRIYCMDLKLRVNDKGDFLYPDLMVTCDARDRPSVEDRFISHPWLIAEVLSDSTAAYDRGRKFELYRGIASLTHYLLIEQDRPHADLFFKNEQGQWVLQALTADDAIQIDRLGQLWPVATLFEEVDFTPPAPPA